ncbi:pyocin, partial [Pseudomonas sp. HMWF007]
RNQKLAYPEIEESGAVVVGKGKPGFPSGTVIPPTRVEIVRPKP